MDADYVLELNNISKSFPGVRALDDVSLKIRRGSVHALVGENGAGKSTLMKIINGIYFCDSGEIVYKSGKIVPSSPKHMLDMGVATIHQELSPILDMTIAENIFLRREPLTKLGFVDKKKMHAQAKALIADLGFRYDPKAKMRTLSISDIQLMEIVKAISREASLVIMDEPTSSITESEAQVLFGQIRRLKDQGVSVIYISHKLDEIFSICDEITILRDGRLVKSCAIGGIDKKTIIELMVGRELSSIYPKSEAAIGETALELKCLCKRGRFSGIDFSIRKGEIVGLAGLVGAGRTELFQTVFGLDRFDSGEVLVGGRRRTIRSVGDAIKSGIIMTPEDRKSQGLVLCRSVRENIAISSLKDYLKLGMISSKRERKRIVDIVNRLSIKVASLNAVCSTLSGGNQQKVVLSKWLLREPQVFILDEPTRGIDVGAKYEIYRLMCELARNGAAVIMISSELPEIIGMCDRIAVMSRGKITGELERKDFTQERIMTLAMKGFDDE